jgi:hypothetical protein
MNAFDTWWHNEGSGMPPLPGEDAETHCHRVCKIAWENAASELNRTLAKLEECRKTRDSLIRGGKLFPQV